MASIPTKLFSGVASALRSLFSIFAKPFAVLSNLNDSTTVPPSSSTALATWLLLAMSIPMQIMASSDPSLYGEAEDLPLATAGATSLDIRRRTPSCLIRVHLRAGGASLF